MAEVRAFVFRSFVLEICWRSLRRATELEVDLLADSFREATEELRLVLRLDVRVGCGVDSRLLPVLLVCLNCGLPPTCNPVVLPSGVNEGEQTRDFACRWRRRNA